MVVSRRDTVRAPTPLWENDYGSQPKPSGKKLAWKAAASSNLEDKGTVNNLTSDLSGKRNLAELMEPPPDISQWIMELRKPSHLDKVQSRR